MGRARSINGDAPAPCRGLENKPRLRRLPSSVGPRPGRTPTAPPLDPPIATRPHAAARAFPLSPAKKRHAQASTSLPHDVAADPDAARHFLRKTLRAIPGQVK